MRRIVAALIGALALASLGSALAAETPIPPSPTTWVTDNARLLSPATRHGINAQLADYNRSTGRQIIVWIGTTTGDASLEDWTIRAFTAWKVGRKGIDDGLALFIFSRDRKVRIEVGYGLEGQLTDAVASRIERDDIVPRLRAGDGDGAVSTGVQALLAAIGSPQGAQASLNNENSDGTNGGLAPWETILGIIVMLFFIALFVRSPATAGWLLYVIASGGRGGFGGYSGGSSSGGGFSGGGGMGGGGGASASW
jgi:uncharacterized protein